MAREMCSQTHFQEVIKTRRSSLKLPLSVQQQPQLLQQTTTTTLLHPHTSLHFLLYPLLLPHFQKPPQTCSSPLPLLTGHTPSATSTLAHLEGLMLVTTPSALSTRRT